MEKIKERGKTYALHKASDKLNDYYGSAMLNVVQFDGHDIQCAYVDGYLQAEQDLETKEVDCEREIGFYTTKKLLKKRNHSTGVFHFTQTDINSIAKHFFELGLKAKEGKK